MHGVHELRQVGICVKEFSILHGDFVTLQIETGTHTYLRS
jgi:hypothetical protein